MKVHVKYIFGVVFISACLLLLTVKLELYKYNDKRKKLNYLGRVLGNFGNSNDLSVLVPNMKQNNNDDLHVNNTWNQVLPLLNNNAKAFKMKGNYTALQSMQSNQFITSILETCNRHKLMTPLTQRYYIYNPEHKVLYCWIRKIASTSFTKLFSDLQEEQIFDNYMKMHISSPKTMKYLESLTWNQKIFKFMIVRHPFERIVSSYRDRIADNSKYTAQAWIYVRKIFLWTRPYLFNVNETNDSEVRIFDEDKKLIMIPTFKEFVTWLIEQPTYEDDVHWDSYYSHCSLCTVNYNSIIKLENFTLTEINYIISKMGTTRKNIIIPRWEITRYITNYHLTCQYFKDLTREIIFKLYERYKIDFQMFNYKFEYYLPCTNG